VALTTQASDGEANTPGLSSAFSKAVVGREASRQPDAHRPRPNLLHDVGSRPLSPQEKRALWLAAQGYGNKAIARGLGCSEQTVKNHITSLLLKLGAANRIDAMWRLGWIAIPSAEELGLSEISLNVHSRARELREGADQLRKFANAAGDDGPPGGGS